MSDALIFLNQPQIAEQKWPVSELELVLEACDPGEALLPGDRRYANLQELRHGIGIARLQRTLALRAPHDSFHHCLLCGHRGSGKSTELLALKKWADENGFLGVCTEVNERFGMIDLDYSDLFLLAATITEDALRSFGHPLPAEKIKRVMQWFQEVIREDNQEAKSEISVEVGGQLGGKLPLSLASLFAKLTAGSKGASSHATKTRETLRRYPETLVDFTQDLLDTANEILRAHGKPRGLLLIFDNLDRYDPVCVDRVLIRSSEQMKHLACHAVFTFPISLAYKPITSKVSPEYAQEVVLPMLALRAKSDNWASTIAESAFDMHKVAALRQLLAERIVLDKLFSRLADVDLLIKMSGGSIRDLIQLVVLAATSTAEDIITSEAVQAAIVQLRGTYMRLLTTTPKDYRCLAAVACRKPVSTADTDWAEQLSRLLFNSCLLEYEENGLPWYDVHPVLIETEEFRHAVDAQK